MPEQAARLWSRFGLLLVLGAILAAYAGLLQAGLVWDDGALITENRVLSEPSWAGVLGHDLWWGTGQVPSPYYRPLMTASLLFDRWVLGGEPALAHLQSLAWHLLTVVGVAGLAGGRLGAGRGAVAALLFGLHPVQSEAVAWIAARNDGMAAAFCVLALLATDRRAHPALVGALATAALLSKESAALLPAIYLLWRWTWREAPRGADLRALLLGLALALGMRLSAELGDFQAVLRVAPDHPYGLPWAVVRWLGWVSWPWPLTATATVYGRPPPFAFVGAAATVAAAFVAFRRAPRLAVGLGLIFFVGLAPAAPTVIGTSMVGERYLYLPMFAVAVLVSALEHGRAAPLAMSAAVIASLGILHLRVPDWASSTSLFGAAARREPDGFSLWLYGSALSNGGRAREAYVLLDAAVAAEPFLPFACKPVAAAAADVLADEAFVARLPSWEAEGCRAAAGFDDVVFLRLVEAGRWELLPERLRTQASSDGSGRAAAVRGAFYAADGDLDALMSASQRHPPGAADYISKVQALAASRR